MKWSHLDNWIVKAAGFLMLMGGLAWTGFAVVNHYVTGATKWDYVPFIVGGIGIVFGAAILARKLAVGATEAILPLLDRLRLARGGTTTTVVAQTTTTPPPANPPKEVG
jgi:hypothetical protein